MSLISTFYVLWAFPAVVIFSYTFYYMKTCWWKFVKMFGNGRSLNGIATSREKKQTFSILPVYNRTTGYTNHCVLCNFQTLESLKSIISKDNRKKKTRGESIEVGSFTAFTYQWLRDFKVYPRVQKK
jgi:hypothetical protein